MDQKRFDELLLRHQVPGATLAVLAGEDVSALASGVLNLSTGVEATTDSLFQIASITKVYTATVFMRLVEQALVGLDTSVVEVLPNFALANRGNGARRQHATSGTAGLGGVVQDNNGTPGGTAIRHRPIYQEFCLSRAPTRPPKISSGTGT
jgi:CubicO group peptidase (beta-lactamase class C family)